MCPFNRHMLAAQALETPRATDATRRKIGSGGPEGQGRCARHRAPRCGANAGMSAHAPMT